MVAGVEYNYFVARCVGLNGKRIEKCFSIDKLCEDEAYKKADQGQAEANSRADGIMAKARSEADKL